MKEKEQLSNTNEEVRTEFPREMDTTIPADEQNRPQQDDQGGE